LIWLMLFKNEISSRGVEPLAQSPYLRRLGFLGLAQNPVDDEGARALARSQHLPSDPAFEIEILGGSRICDSGREALTRRWGTQVC
jgi:hypothetical protein